VAVTGRSILFVSLLGPLSIGLSCSNESGAHDACGHDLSPFHTTVIGIRSDSGQVAWTRADLPVTPAGLTRAVDGKIRLVIEPNVGQLMLDPATGRTVEERPPDTYEISVPPPVSDTAPPDTAPSATLPERPVVSGSTAYVVAGGALVAEDRDSQETKWSVALNPTRAHSFPIPIGNLVVIAQSDNFPTCV